MTSQTINKLAAALVKVQAELKPVPRNAENPFFKSAYADLAACIRHASPLLTEHGIAIVQTGSESREGEIAIRTTIVHESGEWMDGVMSAHLSKNDPQGAGSAITYLCRYGYKAAIGLAQEGEDDDANAASQPVKHQGAIPSQKPTNASDKPKPTKVTAAIRKRVMELLAERGEWATKYLVSTKQILSTETFSDISDTHIPTSKAGMDDLLEKIESFYQTNKNNGEITP